MRRVMTAVASAIALPSDQNTIQDRASGLLAGNNADEFGGSVAGVDELVSQANVSVLAATLVLLDTQDWHDRIIDGWMFQNQTATQRIGQSTDYNFDATVAGAQFSRFAGYLGNGAYSTLAGAAVSNGNPPVRGAGAFTSWFVNGNGTSGQLCIYTDPGTKQLYLYNNTGFTIQATIYLRSVVTGLRP